MSINALLVVIYINAHQSHTHTLKVDNILADQATLLRLTLPMKSLVVGIVNSLHL